MRRPRWPFARRRDPRHALGRRGERVAARFLVRQGLRVLERNVRRAGGEIDLIARDGSMVVFVEVKSLGPTNWCLDLEKIDRRKRRALRRACQAYLRAFPDAFLDYRVDAVVVAFRRNRLGLLRRAEVRWYQAVLDLDGF